MKKMNNKGFTLVELLATIVILGIISTVTIVTVTEYYQRSKEKAEEAFYKQLEGYVYDYITLSGSKLAYVNSGYTNLQKCYKDGEDEICENTTLKKASDNFQLGTLIESVVSKDVLNPKTDVKCTDSNTTLNIYRDSDYVYCFSIKPNGNSCISETISTCENIYKSGSGYLSFK